MNKENDLKLSKEKRDHLISLIKDYFLQEKNEELGDLGASMMLDFIIDKLAPEFYNQGVNDAYKYLSDRLEDVLSIQKM